MYYAMHFLIQFILQISGLLCVKVVEHPAMQVWASRTQLCVYKTELGAAVAFIG